MLFPISHQSAIARRWPVVTTVLILACLGSLIASEYAMPEVESRAEAIAQAAIELQRDNPGVSGCPRLELLAPGSDTSDPSGGAMAPVPTAKRGQVDESAQARFEELCDDLERTIDGSPFYRFGYLPVRNNWAGLITHMFMHGGWLHLLGNMWFLWLTGCNVEDRWGRIVYTAFYLSAGVFAALVHKLAGPQVDIPLVGASGAIAGAMGAFLVTHARTKIKFVLVMFFRLWFFSAPAFVMLPLWLLSQLLWASIGLQDGTAYWAHIGGFGYGLAFAVVMKVSGLDKKLDTAIEDEGTSRQDPRIEGAAAMVAAGRAADALAVLDRLAAEQPRSIDVQLEMLRAAKAAQDPIRESAAYARLIELYLRTGADSTAVELAVEVLHAHREATLPPALRVRIGDRAAALGLFDTAFALYRSVYEAGLDKPEASRAVLAHARVSAKLGQARTALDLLVAARRSPLSDHALDDLIDREIAAIEARDPSRRPPA